MHLFSPLTLRDVTFRNRIAVSPMCQYWAEDGRATDWHLVHYGSRAAGGAGLVIIEATGVEPRGRISPWCLGLWDDAQIAPLARTVRFMKGHGAAAGIQLAHAGRKASTGRPWRGEGVLDEAQGGWRPLVAPSAEPFSADFPVPQALAAEELPCIARSFAEAARRSLEAGLDVVEIHAAHGYLLHQFLSPLSNKRQDAYGGSFDNRTRLLRDVVTEVRKVWPERLPLFVRLSATDWSEGGWDVEQTIEVSRLLKGLGVDLIDVTSAGLLPSAAISLGPGYQTTFAGRVRKEAGIASSAVGLIVSPHQADHVVRTGQADMVLLAREMLRDPYWPLHAAQTLGQKGPWPDQYFAVRPAG